MLSRAFEWYQIVNVKPTSQTIDNRKAAATAVVKAIQESEDWELAFGCASGVAAGFEGPLGGRTEVVGPLVKAIRESDSAFPEDVVENAVELRVSAAMALGELLSAAVQDPTDEAVVIAGMLRSALGLRSPSNGKYLHRMLEELDRAAIVLLDARSMKRRKRPSYRSQELEAAPTAPLTWKSLSPVLNRMAVSAQIDREELNILWWMFAGATTAGKRIADLPAGAAALCCGTELANLSLVPPAASIESMVRRAVEGTRKSQELVEKPLEKFVAEWDAPFPAGLVPDEESRKCADEEPVLLPLSWLCSRMVASQGTSDWKREFERMTGCSAKQPITPSALATQVFRERAAYRAYVAEQE